MEVKSIRGNNRMKKYNGKFKKNLKYILYKDLIFELREKRYTYEKIVEYLKEQGINESLKSVRRICKIVYAEKGKDRDAVCVA